MEYELTLNPDDFGDRSDALFHYRESYPLAHGEINGVKWECQLSNNGEQSLEGKDDKGNVLYDDEVLDFYDTDEKLCSAINDNRVELINNSWWELVFYRQDESSDWWLDIFGDNSEVVDDPEDAVTVFKELMNNEDFIKDFKAELTGETEEATM